jgi:membrane-associated protein
MRPRRGTFLVHIHSTCDLNKLLRAPCRPGEPNHSVLNPESIIQYGGLVLLLLIIFAETGLFFGFFFPGDSLLFVAGLLSGTDQLDINLGPLIALLVLAAVAGSTVGYWTGHWARSYLRSRPDGFLFKRRYIEMTEMFYARYGGMAFFLGRFLPIIRTFLTILAGLSRVPFGKFMLFNVAGAAVWVVSLTWAGHALGNKIPGIADYLEYIVAAMIVLTAIPIVGLVRRYNRENRIRRDPESA